MISFIGIRSNLHFLPLDIVNPRSHRSLACGGVGPSRRKHSLPYTEACGGRITGVAITSRSMDYDLKMSNTHDPQWPARRIRNGIEERRCTHCREWFPEDPEHFRRHTGNPKDLSYECLMPECKALRSAPRRKLDIDKLRITLQPESTLQDIEQIANPIRNPIHEYRARPTLRGRFPLNAADGPGIYAWYSDRTLPLPQEYREGLWRLDDCYLLYIGIVVDRPLQKRLRFHCRGYAGQSQVQQGLVAVLADGTTLCRDASDLLRCLPDDQSLKAWMGQHCYFTWQKVPLPGSYEEDLIHRLRPLLNREHNKIHPFYDCLTGLLSAVTA